MTAAARPPDPSGDPPAQRCGLVAIVGRPNVGKSTLLNALAQRRGLARVSRTPGCTRGVVLFELGLRDGRSLRLADLPGYGFAARGHDERRSWGPLIEGYLTKRRVLRGVVLLIDARRGPEPDEAALVSFLSSHGIPLLLAATKTDKLSASERGLLLRSLGHWGRVIATSGETGLGRDELLRAMLQLAATDEDPDEGTAGGAPDDHSATAAQGSDAPEAH